MKHGTAVPETVSLCLMILVGFLFCPFVEYLEAETIFSTLILWEGVPQLNGTVRKHLLLAFVFESVICCFCSVLNSVLLPKQGICGPHSQHHYSSGTLCYAGGVFSWCFSRLAGFWCNTVFVLWRSLHTCDHP